MLEERGIAVTRIEKAFKTAFIKDAQLVGKYQFPRLRKTSLILSFIGLRGAIGPDYSLLSTMSTAQRIWNCYRNMALSYWMQSFGMVRGWDS